MAEIKGAFTYDVSKILAPFQSDISFLNNPLHSTLIETLNVYLIQLKTERCQVNFMCNHKHIITIIV